MSSDTILVAQKNHDRPNTTRAPEKIGQTLGNIGKSQADDPSYTSYKYQEYNPIYGLCIIPSK